VSVKVNERGETSISGELIELWADQVKTRPKISDLVDEVTAEVTAKMSEEIARAADPLPRSVKSSAGADPYAPRHLDGPLPNLFCDEMQRVAKSDFALHNTFGFRNDIGAGAITVGHLYQVMPFENTLAVMSLSGAQVKELITRNLKGSVSRLQVSSELSVSALEDAQGSTIPSSVEVTFKGHPLKSDETYRVAMNSYMSSGGSCCRSLGELKHHDTAISLRVLFMDTVKRLSPVYAPKTGRIVARRQRPTTPNAQTEH
jgi:2',3'-cyclic-nucleotide 2'-phosphodiesterase (5'-nucleotidase family)